MKDLSLHALHGNGLIHACSLFLIYTAKVGRNSLHPVNGFVYKETKDAHNSRPLEQKTLSTNYTAEGAIYVFLSLRSSLNHSVYSQRLRPWKI